jgi:hypothetical protein
LSTASSGQTASTPIVEAAPPPHVFPTKDWAVKKLSALRNKKSGPIMYTVPGTTPNGLTYNGGPVMLGTVHVYIIWYGNWVGNTATTILPDLAASIGGSPYYNINTTYDDSGNNHVANAVSFAGSTTDSYSHGTSLTDADVQAIVSAAIGGGTLPSDTNGVYFVVTSADVDESSGFCTYYCGWHTHASLFGSDIKYSFVGDAARCPSSCAAQSSASPNGNIGADGMASVLSHELEESVTDPDLNAWVNASNQENADMCAWSFGPEYTVANGSNANMKLGTRDYLIQQNWVNGAGGVCGQAAVASTLVASSMPYAVGYSTTWFHVGSMTPAATIDGKSFVSLIDSYPCGGFGCGTSNGSFSVSGFSANPGAAWLNKISVGSSAKAGASASFSYASGTATWTWTGSPFGVVNGGSYPVTVVHRSF